MTAPDATVLVWILAIQLMLLAFAIACLVTV